MRRKQGNNNSQALSTIRLLRVEEEDLIITHLKKTNRLRFVSLFFRLTGEYIFIDLFHSVNLFVCSFPVFVFVLLFLFFHLIGEHIFLDLFHSVNLFVCSFPVFSCYWRAHFPRSVSFCQPLCV